MATWQAEDHLGIHSKLPALERHRIARLPEPGQRRRLLIDLTASSSEPMAASSSRQG